MNCDRLKERHQYSNRHQASIGRHVLRGKGTCISDTRRREGECLKGLQPPARRHNCIGIPVNAASHKLKSQIQLFPHFNISELPASTISNSDLNLSTQPRASAAVGFRPNLLPHRAHAQSLSRHSRSAGRGLAGESDGRVRPGLVSLFAFLDTCITAQSSTELGIAGRVGQVVPMSGLRVVLLRLVPPPMTPNCIEARRMLYDAAVAALQACDCNFA